MLVPNESYHIKARGITLPWISICRLLKLKAHLSPKIIKKTLKNNSSPKYPNLTHPKTFIPNNNTQKAHQNYPLTPHKTTQTLNPFSKSTSKRSQSHQRTCHNFTYSTKRSSTNLVHSYPFPVKSTHKSSTKLTSPNAMILKDCNKPDIPRTKTTWKRRWDWSRTFIRWTL